MGGQLSHKRASQRRFRWSQHVSESSDALALDDGVFTWDDPRRIAASLQHSAIVSTQRKRTPFQSAMSMLNFYINRAGSQLGDDRRATLEQAKVELRRLFGRV